jgi:hypothetical protein
LAHYPTNGSTVFRGQRKNRGIKGCKTPNSFGEHPYLSDYGLFSGQPIEVRNVHKPTTKTDCVQLRHHLPEFALYYDLKGERFPAFLVSASIRFYAQYAPKTAKNLAEPDIYIFCRCCVTGRMPNLGGSKLYCHKPKLSAAMVCGNK